MTFFNNDSFKNEYFRPENDPEDDLDKDGQIE